MTPLVASVPRLSGRRLLATVGAAASAAIATGFSTARALQALAVWAADPDRLAPVIVALVYLCVTLALLLGVGRNGAQRAAWLGVKPPGLRALTFGVVAWSGAYAAAAVLYSATIPLGLTPADVLEVLWAIGADNGRLHDAGSGLLLLILLRICMLAPVAEELLFRGALFTWLRSRLSAPWTILLTGVGFAVIHQIPAMLPLALIVGLAAGVIRERTGSTTVAIIVHAAQNAIVVALSFVVTGWEATLPY